MKKRNYIILSGGAIAAVLMASTVGALVQQKKKAKKPVLTIPKVEEQDVILFGSIVFTPAPKEPCTKVFAQEVDGAKN